MGIVAGVALAPFAIGLALLLWLVRRAWRYPTPEDITWAATPEAPLAGGSAGGDPFGLPPAGQGPALAGLYRAYLARQSRYQLVGGAAGVILAVIVQVRVYQGIWVGASGPSLPLDPVFACLSGTVAGALLAQAYRLRPGPAGAPVSARLEPRPKRPGRSPRVWSWALVAACLAGGLAAGAAWRNWAPLACAATGAVVVALSELTQDAIWSRRRPLLEPGAMRADARLRALSAVSLAWTQLAIGLLTTAWVFGVLLDGAFGALVWAPLAAAFWAVHRGSLHAPRAWRRARAAALA
ncbi:MAG: hypothetical protein LBC97_13475 [Bifidobacteriaceae bacterium]|jgi:hypothetical protein|nr:hypothetical protein [Bifidobacteriaceae bacterium]